MRDVDQGTLSGLADKLDSLTLSDNEQALLDRLLDRATSYTPEVSGFGQFSYTGDFSGADLSPMAFKVGRSLGILRLGIGVGETTSLDDGPWKPPPP